MAGSPSICLPQVKQALVRWGELRQETAFHMWGSFLQGCEGKPTSPQKLDGLGEGEQTGKVPLPPERDGAKIWPVPPGKLGPCSSAVCLALSSLQVVSGHRQLLGGMVSNLTWILW